MWIWQDLIETFHWGTITWSEMGKQSKKFNPFRPQIDLSKICELFFKEQSNSGIHLLLQIACKHLQKLGGGILSNFSSILFIIYIFMRVRSEKPCLGDSMKCYYYCEVKKLSNSRFHEQSKSGFWSYTGPSSGCREQYTLYKPVFLSQRSSS